MEIPKVRKAGNFTVRGVIRSIVCSAFQLDYEDNNIHFVLSEPEGTIVSLSCYHNVISPLTPGAFGKKCVFWTFWWFLGWISAKLASIWLKMHFATQPFAFLATSIAF